MTHWAPVRISGYEDVPCHAAFEERDGELRAWAQLAPRGKRPMMIYASTNLAEIERELLHKAAAKVPPGAMSAGFFSRMKRKIKKVAKKIGRSKLVRAVAKTAKKALNNPLVKVALAANPYGQAFLLARTAGRVAAKAIRGSKRARAAVRKIHHAATRQRNPHARKAMRLMRAAMKQFRLSPVSFAGDDDLDFDAIAGACLGPVASVGCDSWHASGDEDVEFGAELDALEEFSTAGMWDGARWLASRLGPHSMVKRPDELTARGALLLGRESMAQRFARA